MDELSPRERRQQRTHQAILDAARQLLRENGIDGVSMRAIAERIDYSAAGLYEYFGSKEEIIGELCRQGNRRLKSYLTAVDQTLPFLEYLAALGTAYLDFAMQNPELFLLIFTTVTSQPRDITSTEEWLASGAGSDDSGFPVLVNAIQRGADEGILHVRPGFGVIDMAFAAWSLVHGIAMLRVTHLRTVVANYDGVAREALLAFGKGLALHGTGVV